MNTPYPSRPPLETERPKSGIIPIVTALVLGGFCIGAVALVHTNFAIALLIGVMILLVQYLLLGRILGRIGRMSRAKQTSESTTPVATELSATREPPAAVGLTRGEAMFGGAAAFAIMPFLLALCESMLGLGLSLLPANPMLLCLRLAAGGCVAAIAFGGAKSSAGGRGERVGWAVLIGSMVFPILCAGILYLLA